MSPSSTRKPTEKFDMRPLRTELPPAFVPSTNQPTPQSAASSAYANPVPHPHAHPGHPSTGNIVFGGPESSSSSPAPPQSAGSNFHIPQYPTFGATQPTHSVPPNHAHHASEPYMQRASQPGYGPPGIPWNVRHGYQPQTSQPPYFHPHGHQQFRYPPREVFTPTDVQQPNGHYSRSRSASQSSSAPRKTADDLQLPAAADGAADTVRMAFPESRAPFAPGPPHLRHHQPGHQMAQPPPMPHPDMTSGFENAQALCSHVYSGFANPTLADCHLQIIEEDEGGRQYFDGHKLILSRSSTLFHLIQNSDPPASSTLKTQVHIRLKGRYLRIRAFMNSLRYLYGGPLMSFDQTRPFAPGSEFTSNNEQRMEDPLSHIATGVWLKVPAIAARAVDVAVGLIHWDTLPSLLAFALDGGLSSVWTVDDGSENRSSCSSSDDSLGRPETTGAPTYDPHSTQLLHRVIGYTVHMLPPNFYVDASAPQLASCPRLPSLPLGHESKPSRSDPRLSKIRFGEMSTEDHQRPSIATTTISSLILSLPFALLKCILEHDALAFKLGADTVGSIMRQVIGEREVRRKRVLNSWPDSRVDDAVEAQLIQNLYWEEEVEASAQHRVGLRLARRRRGIDTPLSSGAASDRAT